VATEIKQLEEIKRRIEAARLPSAIKEELERALSDTYFAHIETRLIKDVRNDIEEVKLLDVAPLIVVADGDGYLVIDGQTRLSFYRPFVEKMPCLVVPSLSEEAVLALNIVLNSKRKNLSEPEQREAFTRLINIGWSVEQVANSSNFSAKRVKNQVMIEESASQEVKDAIDSKEFSARKVDESFMGLVEAHYQSKGDKDINGIPKDINQAIQTEVAKYINILNANRQPDEEEITRDWMFQHRTDETVLINSKVMWKDYTPEQIARSSVIKTDEANFICEHPDKVDVMGKTKVWFKYSRK